jgi:hypothetical protein
MNKVVSTTSYQQFLLTIRAYTESNVPPTLMLNGLKNLFSQFLFVTQSL